jgi:hypothetical protein
MTSDFMKRAVRREATKFKKLFREIALERSLHLFA